MSTLYNRARVNTATTGTGTMTLGSAVSAAYFTFAEAGVANGTVVSYVIEDGTNVEMGIGTYTSVGTTLSRTTVTASKISGTAGTTKLTLSGSAVVFIDALAADITVPPSSSTDNAIARFDGTTGRLIQNTSPALLTDVGSLFLINDLADANLQFVVENDSTTTNATAGFNVISGTAAQLDLVSWGNYAVSAFNAAKGILRFSTQSGLGQPIQFWAEGAGSMEVTSSGVYIGASTSVTPDRYLHVERETAATNVVTYLQRYTSLSSGTPAVGIGVGVEFEVETAAGNNEVGATIEAVTTDVTSTSEDFDVVTKIMRAGAAASEAFRVSNDWTYATDSTGEKNYLQHIVYLASQHSVSSTTATEVTGLQHSLVAGAYRYDYRLIVQTSASADGLKFGINYTGTATKIVSMLTWPDTGVTASLGAIDDAAAATTGQVVAHSVSRSETTTAPDMNTGTAGAATQAVNLMVQITGVIVVSDAGDLELWHASESTNATTVEVGSSLLLQRIN